MQYSYLSIECCKYEDGCGKKLTGQEDAKQNFTSLWPVSFPEIFIPQSHTQHSMTDKMNDTHRHGCQNDRQVAEDPHSVRKW